MCAKAIFIYSIIIIFIYSILSPDAQKHIRDSSSSSSNNNNQKKERKKKKELLMLKSILATAAAAAAETEEQRSGEGRGRDGGGAGGKADLSPQQRREKPIDSAWHVQRAPPQINDNGSIRLARREAGNRLPGTYRPAPPTIPASPTLIGRAAAGHHQTSSVRGACEASYWRVF